MSKRIVYTDGPIGLTRPVKDFLPPPEKLVFNEEGVKVTMILNKRSVDYFKRVAKKQRVPYQKLIRTVLDAYAASHPRP